MISAKSSVAVAGAAVVATVGAVTVVEAPVGAVRSLDQSSRDDVGRDSRRDCCDASVKIWVCCCGEIH